MATFVSHKRFVTGVLCLWLWTADAAAQSEAWRKYMADGMAAYQQGRYADAATALQAAVKEAEAGGPESPAMAYANLNLGMVYQALGRHAEAEPLYKHALAILEGALGAMHPDVATRLNNLADLYSAQRRYSEAEPLYKRSLAITEKVL